MKQILCSQKPQTFRELIILILTIYWETSQLSYLSYSRTHRDGKLYIGNDYDEIYRWKNCKDDLQNKLIWKMEIELVFVFSLWNEDFKGCLALGVVNKKDKK